MIRACPICGTDYGLTHGDQTFIEEICITCLNDEKLMEWYLNRPPVKSAQQLYWEAHNEPTA